MRPADSLKRRIVVAFVLFGLGASAFFAFVAAIAVEGIEVQLVDKRLEATVAWAAQRHAAGLDVDMPAGLRFHRNQAIPAPLRGLSVGVHKVDAGATRLHVLAGQDARGKWVLVDHESDYDKIELVVYSMFAAVFVGFMLLASLLGRFLGARVVTPISELAQSVRGDGVPPALTGRTDELGVLARALETHTAELRTFLDRERHFTGDVSHELRSPLTVIMGAAEILMQEGAAPAARAPAERIYRAAHEAAESVTVLLLLARAPVLSTLPPVEIGAVAEAEVEKYRVLLAAKPVTLRYLGGPALTVRAPRELCVAAIGNLVRNACQYTEHGEIVVRVLPGQVIVEDTGPGLPAAVVATLGGGGAPSSGSGGTGLGLALARRICDFLGAGFAYEARAGGGSRFILDFPPHAADSATRISGSWRDGATARTEISS